MTSQRLVAAVAAPATGFGVTLVGVNVTDGEVPGDRGDGGNDIRAGDD